jgi:hypothetical protein
MSYLRGAWCSRVREREPWPESDLKMMIPYADMHTRVRMALWMSERGEHHRMAMFSPIMASYVKFRND